MEVKKQVKLSLGTSICIFIIIVLLLTIGEMAYYYNFVKKDNNNLNAETKQEQTVQAQEKNNIESKYIGDWNVKYVFKSGDESNSSSIINTEKYFNTRPWWASIILNSDGTFEDRARPIQKIDGETPIDKGTFTITSENSIVLKYDDKTLEQVFGSINSDANDDNLIWMKVYYKDYTVYLTHELNIANTNENRITSTEDENVQKVTKKLEDYLPEAYSTDKNIVKNVSIDSVYIYSNDEKNNLTGKYDNCIVGEAVYVLEFNTLEDYPFAGSAVSSSDILNSNSWKTSRYFVYNLTTNSIELSTGGL